MLLDPLYDVGNIYVFVPKKADTPSFQKIILPNDDSPTYLYIAIYVWRCAQWGWYTK